MEKEREKIFMNIDCVDVSFYLFIFFFGWTRVCMYKGNVSFDRRIKQCPEENLYGLYNFLVWGTVQMSFVVEYFEWRIEKFSVGDI